MKLKIVLGSGFRGTLNYILDEGPKATGLKKPEIVGSNLSGTTTRPLAHEFGAARQLRVDIKKPVWHCSLSLPQG